MVTKDTLHILEIIELATLRARDGNRAVLDAPTNAFAIFDQLAQSLQTMRVEKEKQLEYKEASPAAWMYELATMRNQVTGEYSDWRPYLTVEKPNVPKTSIRNLRPLFFGGPNGQPET